MTKEGASPTITPTLGRHLLRTTSFIVDPRRRFSRQSSLSWGHRPHPCIAASCFSFLLPIPFLLRVGSHECYISAVFLAVVTATSYLSDHCYTGMESGWHTVDRIAAPMALTSNIYSVYIHCGLAWASLSLVAVLCHLLANHYQKKNMYEKFVIWYVTCFQISIILTTVEFRFFCNYRSLTQAFTLACVWFRSYSVLLCCEL